MNTVTYSEARNNLKHICDRVQSSHCQSASKIDPPSASNFDPPKACINQARFLNLQLSFPVSIISQ